jgi:flagellar basal body P-ring formation protein FlgA
MIRFVACLTIGIWVTAEPGRADIVVAAHTIRPQSIIGPEDLAMRDLVVPGAVVDPAVLIGMESRVALYANRPIQPGDVGFPATIERNQLITLIYQNGNLLISTEGRALDRAGPGDLIQVMNLTSRTTIAARIGTDGAAYVSE